MTFKPGDRVRCIKHGADNGEVYTVRKIRNVNPLLPALIELEGRKGGYFTDRFELVQGEAMSSVKIKYKEEDRPIRSVTTEYNEMVAHMDAGRLVLADCDDTRLLVCERGDAVEFLEAVLKMVRQVSA